ncbi:hypothetical protein ACN2WE_05760 [Streptomyces sp. cg28]|uniref:hypothetical protein n=1 Tax=Streptomyces sp. cg28 TaxID=3403457 RepID=UPI003B216D9E
MDGGEHLPDFLAACRSVLANVLDELLGLPADDGKVIRQDADEIPADETVIAEEPSAPALVTADVQALRTERGVELHVVCEGQRTCAYYDPPSRTVTVPSGPGRGAYDSPSGAAVAVVWAPNPHVNPNRNGWSFWTVTPTGALLQSIR